MRNCGLPIWRPLFSVGWRQEGFEPMTVPSDEVYASWALYLFLALRSGTDANQY